MAVTEGALVKALYDYQAGARDELTFRKDEVFKVVDASDPDWIQGMNIASGARGLIPGNYIEVIPIGPAARKPSNPTPTGGGFQNTGPGFGGGFQNTGPGFGGGFQARPTAGPVAGFRPPVAQPRPPAMGAPFGGGGGTGGGGNTGNDDDDVQIAVALYDYAAQQSDELSISEGDELQILDSSDPDWFLAKHTNRRPAQPGLVPKTYVSIQEKKRGGKSNVPQGPRAPPNFNGPNAFSSPSPARAPQAQAPPPIFAPKPDRTPSRPGSEPYTGQNPVVEARVITYEKKDDKRYIYQVDVRTYPDMGIINLYRYYNDFYDFHVGLLGVFPDEAGETPGCTRSIPLFPGKTAFVTEAVAKQRKFDIDEYTQQLFQLPEKVSRSVYVQNFFTVNADDARNRPQMLRSESPSNQMLSSSPRSFGAQEGGLSSSPKPVFLGSSPGTASPLNSGSSGFGPRRSDDPVPGLVPGRSLSNERLQRPDIAVPAIPKSASGPVGGIRPGPQPVSAPPRPQQIGRPPAFGGPPTGPRPGGFSSGGSNASLDESPSSRPPLGPNANPGVGRPAFAPRPPGPGVLPRPTAQPNFAKSGIAASAIPVRPPVPESANANNGGGDMRRRGASTGAATPPTQPTMDQSLQRVSSPAGVALGAGGGGGAMGGAAGGLKCKIHRGEDVIVVRWDPQLEGYDGFMRKISSKLQLAGVNNAPKFSLRYKDEDGDYITIAGDDDLQVSLDSMREKLDFYVN